jgi:hypothetical protein
VNDVIDINPMYYGTLAFLAFMTPFFAVAMWIIRGWNREDSKKRPIGFVTAVPESRSRSAE